MPLPKSEYQAVPTEEPKREPPKRKESWPKNPDLDSSASADEVELNGDDKVDQAIQDIAAAPAQDTRIFESFIFDNLRDFDWQLSDDLEVKAVAPFGQAAILGVVPGAWVTGISPAGLYSTLVEKLTDFNKHKEAFLKQNFFKLYIKTVRHPPPLPTPEEIEAEQELEAPPAWNEPPCLIAMQGLEEGTRLHKLLEGQTLMAERLDKPSSRYVVIHGGFILYVPAANATPVKSEVAEQKHKAKGTTDVGAGDLTNKMHIEMEDPELDTLLES